MAERIVRQFIDDLDGSEITDGQGGRVEFGLRGQTYAIDLTADNAAKLEKALSPFIKAATKLGAPTSRRAKAPTKPTLNANGRLPTAQLSAIRDWARRNGYPVSDRGRIAADVVKAFDAAH